MHYHIRMYGAQDRWNGKSYRLFDRADKGGTKVRERFPRFGDPAQCTSAQKILCFFEIRSEIMVSGLFLNI